MHLLDASYQKAYSVFGTNTLPITVTQRKLQGGPEVWAVLRQCDIPRPGRLEGRSAEVRGVNSRFPWRFAVLTLVSAGFANGDGGDPSLFFLFR